MFFFLSFSQTCLLSEFNCWSVGPLWDGDEKSLGKFCFEQKKFLFFFLQFFISFLGCV